MTKVWRKSVNRYWRYRGKIKLPRESRTDARMHARQRHGRRTRKHIASAGAYRRRRLKKLRALDTARNLSRGALLKGRNSRPKAESGGRVLGEGQLGAVGECYKLPQRGSQMHIGSIKSPENASSGCKIVSLW